MTKHKDQRPVASPKGIELLPVVKQSATRRKRSDAPSPAPLLRTSHANFEPKIEPKTDGGTSFFEAIKPKVLPPLQRFVLEVRRVYFYIRSKSPSPTDSHSNANTLPNITHSEPIPIPTSTHTKIPQQKLTFLDESPDDDYLQRYNPAKLRRVYSTPPSSFAAEILPYLREGKAEHRPTSAKHQKKPSPLLTSEQSVKEEVTSWLDLFNKFCELYRYLLETPNLAWQVILHIETFGLQDIRSLTKKFQEKRNSLPPHNPMARSSISFFCDTPKMSVTKRLDQPGWTEATFSDPQLSFSRLPELS